MLLRQVNTESTQVVYTSALVLLCNYTAKPLGGFYATVLSHTLVRLFWNADMLNFTRLYSLKPNCNKQVFLYF